MVHPLYVQFPDIERPFSELIFSKRSRGSKLATRLGHFFGFRI